MNSASAVDRAVHFCNRDAHDTGVSPMNDHEYNPTGRGHVIVLVTIPVICVYNGVEH